MFCVFSGSIISEDFTLSEDFIVNAHLKTERSILFVNLSKAQTHSHQHTNQIHVP